MQLLLPLLILTNVVINGHSHAGSPARTAQSPQVTLAPSIFPISRDQGSLSERCWGACIFSIQESRKKQLVVSGRLPRDVYNSNLDGLSETFCPQRLSGFLFLSFLKSPSSPYKSPTFHKRRKLFKITNKWITCSLSFLNVLSNALPVVHLYGPCNCNSVGLFGNQALMCTCHSWSQ